MIKDTTRKLQDLNNEIMQMNSRIRGIENLKKEYISEFIKHYINDLSFSTYKFLKKNNLHYNIKTKGIFFKKIDMLMSDLHITVRRNFNSHKLIEKFDNDIISINIHIQKVYKEKIDTEKRLDKLNSIKDDKTALKHFEKIHKEKVPNNNTYIREMVERERHTDNSDGFWTAWYMFNMITSSSNSTPTTSVFTGNSPSDVSSNNATWDQPIEKYIDKGDFS